jgi:hypothetical protein
MADQTRAYVLTEDDVNDIAEHVASRDPHALHIPNGSVATLIAMLREVQTELARLIEEKAEDFVGSTTMLRGMEVRDGTIEMDIEPARELLLTWCASVRVMLDDCQAENYAEIDIEAPRSGSVSMDIRDGQKLTDSYTLTLQRRSGKTPHQLRRDAERERDEARAELARVGAMAPAELLIWRVER